MSSNRFETIWILHLDLLNLDFKLKEGILAGIFNTFLLHVQEHLWFSLVDTGW